MQATAEQILRDATREHSTSTILYNFARERAKTWVTDNKSIMTKAIDEALLALVKGDIVFMNSARHQFEALISELTGSAVKRILHRERVKENKKLAGPKRA